MPIYGKKNPLKNHLFQNQKASDLGTFSMLHLVFLVITCNFATIFIRELREGIGRHWGPEGGMMACSYTFSDMTASALFIIFLCTIT